MGIGYLLSFVKEAVIANFFGVSADVDAYTIAIQIPVTLFAFVSVAIKSVVIPMYTDLRLNQDEATSKLFLDHFVSLIALIALSFIGLCEIFASPLIYFFAPGFTDEAHSLSVFLLRITLPTMLFTVIAQIYVAILNVHKRFIAPAFSVYFLNICIIALTIFLHATLGVAAACIGQVMGSLAFALFLIMLARRKYHFSFHLSLRDTYIRKTLKMSLPVLWNISVAEVNTIINRAVASTMFVGSIAALGYASKLNNVFLSLFVAAISSIIFPMFAESSAKGDLVTLNKRVNFTLSVYTMVVLPIMCFLIIFRTEIIEIAFARGKFDVTAVGAVHSLFALYTIGLIFTAFRDALSKVFMSMQDTMTPAKNATIGVLLNIALNLTLPFFLGVQGLALSTSLTAIFISTTLLIRLVRKFEEIRLHVFYRNLLGIIGSAVLFCVVLWISSTLLSSYLPVIFRLLLSAIIGSLCYALAMHLLRVPVWSQSVKMIAQRRNNS